jgi:hypothetical protein
MYSIIKMLGNETFIVSSINLRYAIIPLKSYLLVRRKVGFNVHSCIKNEIVFKGNQYKITILT